MRRIYLDHNASSPLRPSARDAMIAALEKGMNASSVHDEGRQARFLIEDARAAVADALGTDAEAVIFTSGATEANNLALTPQMTLSGSDVAFEKLFVSAVEHPCVLEGGRFDAGQVFQVPVNSNGIIDLTALEDMLGSAGGRALVSVMAANNETGVLQPVEDVARIVREKGGIFHCDAVQLFGRADISGLDADLVTVSSHKIGGPFGVGVLAVRNRGLQIRPLIRGGGQERNQRAGTENAPAIAGFAAAVRSAALDEIGEITYMRDAFETGVSDLPGVSIAGSEACRLPNTSLILVDGVGAETALIGLDLQGVAVSSGSACSSGKVGQSHVLAAMGVGTGTAAGALRFSFGWNTTMDDINDAVRALERVISRARDRQSAA